MQKAHAKNGKHKCWTGKLLSVGVLTGIVGASLAGLNASALTYQEEVPVSFTFNGGISISLSSADLIITDLVPGTTDDSNIITVTTSSNVSSGYTLYATTGNSTTYPNTNLVNNDNTSSPKTINSLATNASIATMDSADASTNGKWGYSFSTNNGTSWTNYSGLPLYTAETGKELIAVNSSANSSIKFKIGAKASANQASGEYKNVVNFIAIGNPEPEPEEKDNIEDLTYMQDFASLSASEKSNVLNSMEINSVHILADKRDEKDYGVAKLGDGNVWMIQNLDFDIQRGTYTPSDTDIPSDWTTLSYTYSQDDVDWDDNYYSQPLSYDPGDLCWNGSIGTGGTLEDHTTSCPNGYSIGNYYNWTAAVAMDDSSSYITDGADTDQSICPAGWTLPKASGQQSFVALVYQAGLTAGISGNIHLDPYYFVYGGIWTGDGSFGVGGDGSYWTSVVSGVEGAYILDFHNDGDLYADADGPRSTGLSVRCLAR